MKNKAFDCVELQHRGAALVQEQLKGLTPEEQLEFWRKQTEALRQQQQIAREKAAKQTLTRPRASAKPRRTPKSRRAA